MIQSSAACALLLTTCYLFYGIVQNSRAEDIARAQLTQEGISFTALKAYPTLFQIFVRRIVVHTSTDIMVGFISTRTPKPIRWYRQVKYSGPLLHAFNQQYCVKKFKWFCDNDYVVTLSEDIADTYIARIYDLRYGGVEDATILGLWGRMIKLDKRGQLISNCQPFYTVKILQ